MKKFLFRVLLGKKEYTFLKEVVEEKIDLLHYDRTHGKYYQGLDNHIDEIYKFKNKYFGKD